MTKAIVFMAVIAAALGAKAEGDAGQARVSAAETRWSRATQPTMAEMAHQFRCISLLNNGTQTEDFSLEIEALSSDTLDGYESLYFRPTGSELQSDPNRNGVVFKIRKESATKFLIAEQKVQTLSASQIPEAANSIPEKAPTQAPAQTRSAWVTFDALICVP